MIEVADLVKRHGPTRGARGVSLSVRRGEVAVDHRPVRQRQEHVPPLPERAGDRSRPARCQSTACGSTPARGRERRRDSLPRLRRRVGMVFQSSTCSRTGPCCENVMEGPVYVAGQAATRPRREAAAAARPGRPVRPAATPAPAALRRPAAAGGHRPGAGDGAPGDPLRRADQRARPADDRRGARRDDRPGRRRPDHDRGHPRHAVRPPRRPHRSRLATAARSSSPALRTRS